MKITGTTHKKAAEWVEQIRQLCKPDSVYWCDGSEEENTELCNMLVEKGTYIRLNPEKRPGCFLARSTPSDVARGGTHVHLLREAGGRRPHQQLEGPGRDEGYPQPLP